MMSTKCYRRLLDLLAVGMLLLVSASCVLVEERIDRAAGGPNVPADTAVHMDLKSAEKPDQIAARTVPAGPLRVTIAEAILLCLENNRALVVQRLDPAVQQTFEDQERAVFDPAINADVSGGRVEGSCNSPFWLASSLV